MLNEEVAPLLPPLTLNKPKYTRTATILTLTYNLTYGRPQLTVFPHMARCMLISLPS